MKKWAGIKSENKKQIIIWFDLTENQMKKNKIILLDLGGVVFQSTGLSNQFIDWKIISNLNNVYGHDLNIGRDKFPDFIADYNSLTKQSLSGKDFLIGVFDTLEINRELIEMATNIGDIVIVSDNYRENIMYISKRYAFHEWAKKQIYSFDYEMEKTNPLFFERLLKELNEYDLKDFIFIDDSPNKIASAAIHGIKSILYQNNEQIKKELNLPS
jgi:FMN phosphatase YigB (HAD superfamily)